MLKYSDDIQHTFSTGEGDQEIERQVKNKNKIISRTCGDIQHTFSTGEGDQEIDWQVKMKKYIVLH